MVRTAFIVTALAAFALAAPIEPQANLEARLSLGGLSGLGKLAGSAEKGAASSGGLGKLAGTVESDAGKVLGEGKTGSEVAAAAPKASAASGLASKGKSALKGIAGLVAPGVLNAGINHIAGGSGSAAAAPPTAANEGAVPASASPSAAATTAAAAAAASTAAAAPAAPASSGGLLHKAINDVESIF